MIRQAVTAIIHLAKRGRSASGRYGKFSRPDKSPHELATDLHLWEGRELSVAEFNAMFPTAIKSVMATDTVYGQIIVREVDDGEVAGGATPPDELAKLQAAHEAVIEALKNGHAQALASVQDVVNEFTQTHNANLAAANTRILELELAASQPNPSPEGDKNVPVTGENPEGAKDGPVADETISGESARSPLVEAEPSVAGEQPAASLSAIPEAAPEAAPEPEPVIEAAPEVVEAAPAAKKKAKK